jgi:reactive intermediate/imine deaminase
MDSLIGSPASAPRARCGTARNSYRWSVSSRPIAYTSPSVRTPPGYSHAVHGAGLIFVSGQVALDPEGSIVGVGDMSEQARQAFRNLGAVLEAAGCSFTDVVKLTYFVRDIEAVGSIRAARDEFVDTANPPASTLVEVSRLFMPDLLIEIEAVAVAPQPTR